MGDKLDRLNRDRLLFQPNARRKLVDTIGSANPEIVARVIVKALELQIITEDFARENGLELDPVKIAEFRKNNSDDIDDQLERAIIGFIGSIVSHEG